MQGTGGRTLTPEELTDALPRWRDAGGTKASVVTMQRGFTNVDQHIEYLADTKAKLDAAVR